MNITGCTAVTDIVLNVKYDKAWTNLRVGGIAGVAGPQWTSAMPAARSRAPLLCLCKNSAKSTSIWASGLVGGIMLRYEGGLSKLVERLIARSM